MANTVDKVLAIAESEVGYLEKKSNANLYDKTKNAGSANYTKYGNTIELYDNWFFRAVSKGTKFEQGLTRRRNAEWAMFNRGEYVY